MRHWPLGLSVGLFLIQAAVLAGAGKSRTDWTEADCSRVLSRYSRRRRLVLRNSPRPDLFSPRHNQLAPEVLEAATRWEGLRERLEPDALEARVRRLPENRNVLSIWIGLDAPESTANPGQIVFRIEPSQCVIRDPKSRERFLRPIEPVAIPTFVMEALLHWSKLDRATVVSFLRDAKFWRQLGGDKFELEYHYDLRDTIYFVKFSRELIEDP